MKVIMNCRLLEFSAIHHEAGSALQSWRKAMESIDFASLADLREVFRSVDKVDDLHVFNIAGNKYRLIAFLQLDRQLCYIKQVLTHTEYDKGAWKK
ncbi:MAG: type II toxin-antitoxin system HigB family toxin [Gallionella sp.]|nr:type II toxin-antitoxin system HigB family toxin [Gallionella sp.]